MKFGITCAFGGIILGIIGDIVGESPIPESFMLYGLVIMLFGCGVLMGQALESRPHKP